MGNYPEKEETADFMSTLCCKHWVDQMNSDNNGVTKHDYNYRDNGYCTSPIKEKNCQVCNYQFNDRPKE